MISRLTWSGIALVGAFTLLTAICLGLLLAWAGL
jgi:hypothetical protein